MSKRDTHALSRLASLRQLEILLTLADQGSIARTAEALFLTQPSVSIQLKRLSEAIGLPLYEQIGRRIHLTEAGQRAAATAREVFDSFSRLDMQLNDLKGLQSGRLQIAVVTTASYFLPHLIGPFCQRYPGITVELKVGNRAEIIERLAANLDDLYIFSDPPEDLDIVRYPFLPNPLVVIASKQHPLARRRKLRWQDLQGERFILREAGSSSTFATHNHLQSQGLSIQQQITIESNEVIRHAVMANLGITILSAYVLVNSELEGLVQLDVAGFPIMSEWQLVHLTDKKFSVAASQFLRFVREEGHQYLPLQKIHKRVQAAQRGKTRIEPANAGKKRHKSAKTP